jgi:hypothetical protein
MRGRAGPREAAADGFWSQIEEYLDKQTGTRVSHGRCPDCSERLHAESGVGLEKGSGAA